MGGKPTSTSVLVAAIRAWTLLLTVKPSKASSCQKYELSVLGTCLLTPTLHRIAGVLLQTVVDHTDSGAQVAAAEALGLIFELMEEDVTSLFDIDDLCVACRELATESNKGKVHHRCAFGLAVTDGWLRQRRT